MGNVMWRRARVWPWLPATVVAVLAMPGCGGGGGGSGTSTGGPTSVSGTVSSAGTGGGLGGMSVAVTSGPDAGRSTSTDANGDYTLAGLAQLGFKLRVSGPQFETVTVTANSSIEDISLLHDECPGSSCSLSPSSCNEQLPMFRLPFNGTFPFSAQFDHTSPGGFIEDGEFVSYCGGGGFYDSHTGWDFPMSVGTPILAAAKGQVIFSGREDPFFCPFLGTTVAGLWVVMSHTSPHGEEIFTLYGHLSELIAEEGQSVGAGKRVGLSGNTGCSTGPHMHFEVIRRLPGPNNPGFDDAFSIDPFGWQGAGRDPWAIDPNGAVSPWMWKGPVGGAMSFSAISTRDRHNLPLRELVSRPWSH